MKSITSFILLLVVSLTCVYHFLHKPSENIKVTSDTLVKKTTSPPSTPLKKQNKSNELKALTTTPALSPEQTIWRKACLIKEPGFNHLNSFVVKPGLILSLQKKQSQNRTLVVPTKYSHRVITFESYAKFPIDGQPEFELELLSFLPHKDDLEPVQISNLGLGEKTLTAIELYKGKREKHTIEIVRQESLPLIKSPLKIPLYQPTLLFDESSKISGILPKVQATKVLPLPKKLMQNINNFEHSQKLTLSNSEDLKIITNSNLFSEKEKRYSHYNSELFPVAKNKFLSFQDGSPKRVLTDKNNLEQKFFLHSYLNLQCSSIASIALYETKNETKDMQKFIIKRSTIPTFITILNNGKKWEKIKNSQVVYNGKENIVRSIRKSLTNHLEETDSPEKVRRLKTRLQNLELNKDSINGFYFSLFHSIKDFGFVFDDNAGIIGLHLDWQSKAHLFSQNVGTQLIRFFNKDDLYNISSLIKNSDKWETIYFDIDNFYPKINFVKNSNEIILTYGEINKLVNWQTKSLNETPRLVTNEIDKNSQKIKALDSYYISTPKGLTLKRYISNPEKFPIKDRNTIFISKDLTRKVEIYKDHKNRLDYLILSDPFSPKKPPIEKLNINRKFSYLIDFKNARLLELTDNKLQIYSLVNLKQIYSEYTPCFGKLLYYQDKLIILNNRSINQIQYSSLFIKQNDDIAKNIEAPVKKHQNITTSITKPAVLKRQENSHVKKHIASTSETPKAPSLIKNVESPNKQIYSLRKELGILNENLDKNIKNTVLKVNRESCRTNFYSNRAFVLKKGLAALIVESRHQTNIKNFLPISVPTYYGYRLTTGKLIHSLKTLGQHFSLNLYSIDFHDLDFPPYPIARLEQGKFTNLPEFTDNHPTEIDSAKTIKLTSKLEIQGRINGFRSGILLNSKAELSGLFYPYKDTKVIPFPEELYDYVYKYNSSIKLNLPAIKELPPFYGNSGDKKTYNTTSPIQAKYIRNFAKNKIEFLELYPLNEKWLLTTKNQTRYCEVNKQKLCLKASIKISPNSKIFLYHSSKPLKVDTHFSFNHFPKNQQIYFYEKGQIKTACIDSVIFKQKHVLQAIDIEREEQKFYESKKYIYKRNKKPTSGNLQELEEHEKKISKELDHLSKRHKKNIQDIKENNNEEYYTSFTAIKDERQIFINSTSFISDSNNTIFALGNRFLKKEAVKKVYDSIAILEDMESIQLPIIPNVSFSPLSILKIGDKKTTVSYMHHLYYLDWSSLKLTKGKKHKSKTEKMLYKNYEEAYLSKPTKEIILIGRKWKKKSYYPQIKEKQRILKEKIAKRKDLSSYEQVKLLSEEKDKISVLVALSKDLTTRVEFSNTAFISKNPFEPNDLKTFTVSDNSSSIIIDSKNFLLFKREESGIQIYSLKDFELLSTLPVPFLGRTQNIFYFNDGYLYIPSQYSVSRIPYNKILQSLQGKTL